MAGKDANIIRLDSAVEPQPQVAVPGGVLPIRTHTIDYFRRLLPPLFDQTDDTLFSMSGHATLHGEQSLLFDGMRTLRMQKQAIIECFLSGISRWFEPGCHLEDYDDVAPNLTCVRTENLALVGEEDLEEQLAIAGLLARIQQGEKGKLLLSLNKRLASLYDLNDIPIHCSPVGPVAAGSTFLSAIEPLELPLKVRLVILKIFEQSYLAGVEEFYRRSNNELRDSGICPDLEKQARQQRAQAARDANGCMRSASTQAECPPSSSHPPAFKKQSSENTPSTTSISAAPVKADPPQGISVIGHQELMGLLSLLQARQPEIEQGGVVTACPSLRETMDIALAGIDGSKALEQKDDELIDMVSMLFEFILDDHELPEAIKALIGRLQIPVLKLAILDRNFLSRRSHPARQLLNGLASAGVQVMRQGDAQNKRLCREVENIVVTVLHEFTTDVSVFEKAFKSFKQFQQEEKARVDRSEQRIKEAEDAHNRSENARAVVQKVIDRQISGRQLPEGVQSLLFDAWGSYLFIVYLKQGKDSNAWKRAVRVIEHIILSVQPCSAKADMKRRELWLPKLYEALELGLNSIAYDSSLTELHMSRLKAIHNEQVQNLPEAEASIQMMTTVAKLDELAADPQPQPANNFSEDTAALPKTVASAKVDFNQKLQQWQEKSSVDRSGSDDEEELEEECIVMEAENGDFADFSFDAVSDKPTHDDVDLSGLRIGAEVIFGRPGQGVTCRLVRIASNGNYIFENANGLRIAEKPRNELVNDIRNGQLLVQRSSSKDEQVIDRAIQSVISNFRLFGDRK